VTRRFHPSIPAISFIIWWLVASVVFPARMLNSDGDLLRHIGHGEWMLRHHSLIHNDPFSWTMGGQPFVGFEYGSQIIFALVHRAAGLAGVAIFAGLLIATAYALLARFLLRRGVDALLTYLVTVAAAVLGAVHWAPRPHLFTLVAVVVLMPMLESSAIGRRSSPALDAPSSRFGRLKTEDRRLLLALPLFAIWANLHGGWVFGLVLIGIYFAGHFLDWLVGRNREYQLTRMKNLAALFGCGLVGTLCTPHFVKLHKHVLGFLGDKWLLDNTQEFMSPDFHQITGKLFLLALLGVMLALALSKERPSGPHLLVILVMTYFVLNARRNMQLFGVTALPVLAIHVNAAWKRLPDWRGIRGVFDRDAKTGVTTPYVLGMIALFGFLAVGRGNVLGAEVIPNAISPEEFPVAVVQRARAEHVTGRIYNDYTWGGYMIYAWPEQKVFIDGGADFYGPELTRTWSMIGQLQPFWRDSLERFGVNLVLVPTGAAFTHELLREPGWRLKDCDATAALLQKSSDSTTSATSITSVPSADSLLDACFKRSPVP
jgi:hypothetical protein